jgi:hypothetical protein
MTNKAMRLYMLRDVSSGAIVTDANGSVVYFTNKMDAKAQRQEGEVVSRGPDHKHGPSQVKGAY